MDDQAMISLHTYSPEGNLPRNCVPICLVSQTLNIVEDHGDAVKENLHNENPQRITRSARCVPKLP